MKELAVKERVQPQGRGRGAGRDRPAPPKSAADRIARLEHDVAECFKRIDELRTQIADLPD